MAGALGLIAFAASLSATTLAADKVPTGPELAPREIGTLIKAYPLLTQNNPLAIEGVGVMLWGCDYQVGKARITITITTKPSDPMPCKRKVAFE
jgi:hypothetical protein